MVTALEQRTSKGYYRVGGLAGLLGCSTKTVRRYEERGIIPEAERDPINGTRVWTRAQVERILAELRPI
jgi:DNA-binding transcriptional MerR regulator